MREEAGSKELVLDLPEGSHVEHLRGLLEQRYPIFGRMGDGLAVSVNLEMASSERTLEEDDEVAFLPPVAGGAGSCTISSEPLDERSVAARVTGPDAGGVVSFLGAVRDRARGRSIKYLEYEAYPEMAEREMQKIVDQAGSRWPGTRVAIAHRTGHLEIGDLAVVVVAAAAHREEAFEACRFAIETLKKTVPIWKKEVAVDGEYWVDDHP